MTERSSEPVPADALLLTYEHVARLLQVSLSTVRRLARSGELPEVFIGEHSPRFRRADVEALITSRVRSSQRARRL